MVTFYGVSESRCIEGRYIAGALCTYQIMNHIVYLAGNYNLCYDILCIPNHLFMYCLLSSMNHIQGEIMFARTFLLRTVMY